MNQEINLDGLLYRLPSWAKKFILIFVLVLSFGYAVGLVYLSKSSGVSPTSVEQNYLGNDSDLDAEEMKFKMPEKAVLTLVHGHVISFSLIFFSLGGLLMCSSQKVWVKNLFAIEPLVSTVTTFGGIWLMWWGVVWMKYVVILSGTLMHISFVVMVVLVLRDVLRK